MMTRCHAAVALAHFALSAAVFLHSDMNFFRSLPCKLLPSASFEHSRDAAVRGGFSAFFSAGAVFVAGAGVAGAVACANAELIRSRDANAVAAAREDMVIMGVPRCRKGATSRCDAEPWMNETGRAVVRDYYILPNHPSFRCHAPSLR